MGIYLDSSSSNSIINSTASSHYFVGIFLLSSSNNTIYNNIIQNNANGIYLYYSDSNLIYNNLFNNTYNNFVFGFDGDIYPNYWNTSYQSGNNIWNSSLGYIGGNLWTTPDGNGYSDTCNDTNADGFCDDPYVLATDNIDYLPITKTVGQYPYYISVTFSYSNISFGTVNPYSLAPAIDQNFGYLNVSVNTSSNYQVKAYALDWTGPQTIPASTLYFDTNETYSNLSYSNSIQLNTSYQIIDTYPSTVTTNYHGFWFNVPLAYAGDYNTTIIIDYSIL
jgi:parallel beta-helix repeat protein